MRNPCNPCYSQKESGICIYGKGGECCPSCRRCCTASCKPWISSPTHSASCSVERAQSSGTASCKPQRSRRADCQCGSSTSSATSACRSEQSACCSEQDSWASQRVSSSELAQNAINVARQRAQALINLARQRAQARQPARILRNADVICMIVILLACLVEILVRLDLRNAAEQPFILCTLRSPR